MGIKAFALTEGQRYRVQTAKAVFYGIFYDRETIDGEQYLMFIDESRTDENNVSTARIRVGAIKDVQLDFD